MPSISDISITIRAITKPYIKAIRGATTATMRFVSTLGRDLISALFSIKGLIATVFAGAVFGRFIQGAVGAASSLESLNAQFKVLLGGQEEANKRMKELVKFSAQTPFQIQDIAQANKVLQSLTGGLLATTEGMTLVGDAAAFADRPIREISVQIGRLFSGIQAGTAVGEPIARLRELGLVSAETGQQISDLLKQGMKGDQVWALAERELRKVTGTMEAMSKTTKGLWSTFKDKLNLVMANFGRVLLPLVRAVLIKLNEILDKVILSTKNLADEIGSTAKIGIGFVKMLDFMRIALVNLFAGGEINKNFMAFEKGLLTAFGSVAFFFKKLSEAKGTIKNDFKDIGNIIFIMFKTIGEHILGFWGNIFVSIFKKVKNFFHTVHKAHEAVATLSISELGKDDFNKFFKRLNQIELKSKSIDKRIAQSFKNNIGKTLNDRFEKNIQEYIKATEKQRGKLGEAFGELLLGDPQQRKDFINKFIMDVTQEFAKIEKGMELDLTVDDKGGMLDKISKVAKTLKPTLAVRGSQEAFRIGQDSDLMKKQLKANEQQVKQQKITNDLLNNIGNMIGNVTKFGRAKPFNPNIQAGAGAGGVN